MVESSEVAALKAAFLGVVDSYERLQRLRQQVEGLDPAVPPAPDALAELDRASGAHAIAAQALRGLVRQLATAKA
jgi:hypothetical protein